LFEHLDLATLSAFLPTARRVLRPGGLFPNYGITHDAQGLKMTVCTEFVYHYVFVDGELECINNIEVGMERAGVENHAVQGLRPHSSLTLRHRIVPPDTFGGRVSSALCNPADAVGKA
jgi:cyclopropane-fatty-acyl-phospholipid synthase